MKAIVYERYGPPEVLELREIEKPTPKKNEVLIKVYATTVTAGDWRMRKADPFLARLYNGLFRPKRVKVLGFEFSGVIEELGQDVVTFKKGDKVFASCGLKFGGYAEYKSVPVNDLIALKPINMTFEEAATVPIGGLTALQFVNSTGLKQDDKILIYGASGSVGTFAVQIAKALGADVTAVCSASNINLVKSLGADVVIDYTRDDFTKVVASFDVIFDAVGKTTKSACKTLLKPTGKYVSVTGSPNRGINDLLRLKELIEAEKVKSVIDRNYTLQQIREAHTYVESFRKRGNVTVSIVPQLSASR